MIFLDFYTNIVIFVVQSKKNIKKMITGSAEDYFKVTLTAMNMLVPNEKKRLIKSEITFLVNAALYHYEGGDLKDLNALYDYLKGKPAKSKNHFNVLRCNIATKQFIPTSREELILPRPLKKRKGEALRTTISYVDTGEN